MVCIHAPSDSFNHFMNNSLHALYSAQGWDNMDEEDSITVFKKETKCAEERSVQMPLFRAPTHVASKYYCALATSENSSCLRCWIACGQSGTRLHHNPFPTLL